MCRHDFRIKVDLSQFYDDVRRYSWIYVDKGTVSCVCHLQKHITKVFDIQEPFHLLLETGEYLPPNEDSRILKEDETIVVVPGTGLQNNHSSQPKTTSDSQNNIYCRTSLQEECISDSIIAFKINEPSNKETENLADPLETTSENTVFLSMMNDSQVETQLDSQPDISFSAEQAESETSSINKKRKRVRRKRSKNVTLQEESVSNGTVAAECKKPKMTNSVDIPNGKHIRFKDAEKPQIQEYDSSVSNDSKKQDAKATDESGPEDFFSDKPGSVLQLTNLLALRQSSTPITFGRKKIEETTRQGNPQIQEVPELVVVELPVSGNKTSITAIDPKKYPLLVDKPVVNDMIAFKMLKMGSDYTPQVSAYIVAKLLQVMPDKSSYKFKILGGKSEIRAPGGKFEIEDRGAQYKETDTFTTLDLSQLIETRLIHRKFEEYTQSYSLTSQ